MRKEKEIPTRIKAYKFRIFPEYQKPDFDDEIKQIFFTEARTMNGFWNRLIEIRVTILTSLDEEFTKKKSEFESEEDLSYQKLKKLSPDFLTATEAIWEKFETDTRAIAKSEEIKNKLGWEAREDVFNRFETSHKKALKTGGELKMKSEKFIEQFHLPHRFTGGGKELLIFTTGRSKKIFIEDLAEDFYQNDSYRNRKQRVAAGRFGIGIGDATQVKFRIVLHRRIPANAKIKTAVLTGKFRNRKWEYFLVLTVEESLPPVLSNSGKRPVAGLDLGWRKFDDYLRVGVIVDSNGNAYELRLPINPPKKRSLRRLERLQAKHGFKMRTYPQNWQDIEDFQTRNSSAKDRVKEQVLELELPEHAEIKVLKSRWERVGKRGLMKLKRILESEEIPQDANTEKAKELLSEWLQYTWQYESEIDYARQRLIGQRKIYYAQIANWLKANYAEIAIEGDLSLKRIAEASAKAKLSESGGAVIKNSAKYRVIASLYELKSALAEREMKSENWLVKQKSAFTTTTCYICGAECENTANLEITCLKGHRNDQDVQAGLNLRNNLAEDFPDRKSPFLIPVELRNIIVPLEQNL